MTGFSHSKFYEGFRSIRNKFAKYDTDKFIVGVIKQVSEPYEDRLEYLKRQPWNATLLIKWVVADRNSFEQGKLSPAANEIQRIRQELLELSDRTPMPNDFPNLTLWFRAIAYQQIYLYQFRPTLPGLTRQLLYFAELPVNHPVRKQWKAISGIDIQVFVELCLMLSFRFLDEKNISIGTAWFSTVHHVYPAMTCQRFLDLVSATAQEIREVIWERDRALTAQGNSPRNVLEYYENSPFLSKPLLKYGDEYLCINQHILYRSLESFIYDRLREADAALFMSTFGPIFEDYVKRAIENSGASFVSESDLRTHIGGAGVKLVDFVLPFANGNVYIDAKAVEMHYNGKVALTHEDMQKWTKTSIAKAVEQAHSVIDALQGRPHPAVDNARNSYLIVVTFKEFYIGNGRALKDCIGSDAFGAMVDPTRHTKTISPENMYFMTIVEFELLSEAIKQGKTTLIDALEDAKDMDSKPETRVMDFRQHINRWGYYEMPQYVTNVSDTTIDKITDYVPHD
jgi:hypothetical protein